MATKGVQIQHSTVTGPTIITSAWSDLGRLPQPVFHRDELAKLRAVKATPERYADVAAVKRCFRGAYVIQATPVPRPVRRRRKRPTFGWVRAYAPEPEVDDAL